MDMAAEGWGGLTVLNNSGIVDNPLESREIGKFCVYILKEFCVRDIRKVYKYKF